MEKIITIAKEIKKGIKPFFKMIFYNTICKGWIESFGSHDRRKLKYRISLCLIFKDEAPFLKEWIDYHLTIGIDHFYLYNNNSEDNYLNVLEPYIGGGLVTLIDWPEPYSQFKAYKHCFDTYRLESNWIAFIDADEFICPKYDTDINDWIKKFDKYPSIMIHWLIFGTGGQITHDINRWVIEQYFSSWDYLYRYGKCLINTRYNIADYSWHVHHHTYMKYRIFGVELTIPSINQFGYICPVGYTIGGGNDKLKNANIQINHYFTKAWDVYSSKRIKSDVFYSYNLKQELSRFYQFEDKCISSDHTIERFFIRMKLFTNKIK